ncbi:hypothetical protein [Pantoea sp. R102]|uniref:hypothetical protein n=1 Tax=Pantoea sp. R102 TaxID=2507583 RepID=UPI0014563D31|nr:hypothetical protein [Pantoea sp. R102]
MAKYSKKARDAFKAEMARKHIYWEQLLEESARYTFDWTERVLLSAYRRNYISQEKE